MQNASKHGNLSREMLWLVIPSVLLAIFGVGQWLYSAKFRSKPSDVTTSRAAATPVAKGSYLSVRRVKTGKPTRSDIEAIPAADTKAEAVIWYSGPILANELTPTLNSCGSFPSVRDVKGKIYKRSIVAFHPSAEYQGNSRRRVREYLLALDRIPRTVGRLTLVDSACTKNSQTIRISIVVRDDRSK